MRDELTDIAEIPLRGHKIIITRQLEFFMFWKLHTGHPEITKREEKLNELCGGLVFP